MANRQWGDDPNEPGDLFPLQDVAAAILLLLCLYLIGPAWDQQEASYDPPPAATEVRR